MNTNNSLPNGWTVMQRSNWQPHALQTLIDTNPYPAALAKLQKQKEDCGYTDKWYREELRKLNREWLNKVQSAIEENTRYIDEQQAEMEKVRNTNFEHHYTERDYADLQFMQSLIKTRITAEGQNNGVLIGRIVDDYINTQVGARAIMFLSGDSEVGEALQDYYPRAAQNAKSAAEVKFEKDKAAELAPLAIVIAGDHIHLFTPFPGGMRWVSPFPLTRRTQSRSLPAKSLLFENFSKIFSRRAYPRKTAKSAQQVATDLLGAKMYYKDDCLHGIVHIQNRTTPMEGLCFF